MNAGARGGSESLKVHRRGLSFFGEPIQFLSSVLTSAPAYAIIYEKVGVKIHMAKYRYNRTFKNGLMAILFCFVLFGSVIVYSIVANIQYGSLVSKMKSVEATIVDIDWDLHIKGPDEQIIHVTYEVDGVTYNRELETDTSISFSPGRGANYSIGDKLEIFYDPQNPSIIASPRSVGVGYFYMAVGLFGLALVSLALIYMVKFSRKFLVTQAEYEKEKEERKRNNLARKEREKELKSAKREKYAKARKIVKMILIVLAVLLGAFILFLLFGVLLMALGY